MMRVKDIDGSIIRGARKTESGSIVFSDPQRYKHYTQEKQKALQKTTDLEELRDQIRNLTELVKNLQKENNG